MPTYNKIKQLLGRLADKARRPGKQDKPDNMLWLLAAACLAVVSCAKMGQPDGGWYDETPPVIVRTTPQDKGVNVKQKKITIYFDEFIQVDNPTEKVVISPPQIEQAEIQGAGKKIEVELKDSLKANTTYTIDFSDAISDNNENNPLGNYTYTFSTGGHIDTLEVAGYVLNAKDLEPIKGILVGLYADLGDSAFTKQPMLRVSRTDSRGRFVIKGIAPGSYRIYALQDADNNYVFSQKSEQIAMGISGLVSGISVIFKPVVWLLSVSTNLVLRCFMPDNPEHEGSTLGQDSHHCAHYRADGPAACGVHTHHVGCGDTLCSHELQPEYCLLAFRRVQCRGGRPGEHRLTYDARLHRHRSQECPG